MKNLSYALLLTLVFAACTSEDNTQDETSVDGEAKAVAAEPIATEKANDPSSETALLNEWFERKYEEELLKSPIALTSIGRKDRYDEIDDFSEEAFKEQVEWKQASVDEMKATFDYQSLTDDGKISWDLWEYQNHQSQAGYKWRTKNYVFHQMTGVHSYLPTFMISFHDVESEADMEAYIMRLNAIGRGIDQLVDVAKVNAEDGTRPPRFSYEIVADQAKNILNGKPFTGAEEEAPLSADANKKIQALVEAQTIDQARASELRAAAEKALLDSVKPAYENLIAFIEDDMASTSEEAKGVGSLTEGKYFYMHRLRAMTTTELTADEIHQIGLDEVARLRLEMEELKAQSGFEGSLLEFFAFLRDSKDDDRFFYSNDDAGAQSYIDDATAAIENIKAELPNYFGILPKADLVVKRVESFREQDGAPQHYFAGTPDGSRPGIYYAHLSDMTAMPKQTLEVIAYHEGLPGHHMQISIAQELSGVPTFRTQAGFTAYSEGWGLYSELLAKEMPNTYQDLYSDFGRLNSEIWRAIRLVVDTGIHARGWTQQQAVEYFSNNAPTPLPAIEAEVRRYFVLPGQATSYKIGMLNILRLRKFAEAELGEAFDIREFHDIILGGGALPLSLLERQVKNWVQARSPAS